MSPSAIVEGAEFENIKVKETLIKSESKSHANGTGEATTNGLPATEVPYTILEQPNRKGRKIKVITIGAGASALNFAHDIDTSLDVDLTIYEKNPEIGGTWYENR